MSAKCISGTFSSHGFKIQQQSNSRDTQIQGTYSNNGMTECIISRLRQENWDSKEATQWANEPHLKYSIHWKILTQSLNIIARKGELLIVGKNWQQIYREETKVLDRQFTGCWTDWTSSDVSLLWIQHNTIPAATCLCCKDFADGIQICRKTMHAAKVAENQTLL